MRKVMMVACAVLALGACKKDKWEQAVSDLEGFRDKMCACKDKDCVEGVNKDMKAWEKGMEDKMGKDEKPPEKLMERGDKAEKELRECKKAMRKAGEGKGGEEAPPGESAAPGSAAAPAGSAAAPAGSAAAPATP
jgi:hypothetical protein